MRFFFFGLVFRFCFVSVFCVVLYGIFFLWLGFCLSVLSVWWWKRELFLFLYWIWPMCFSYSVSAAVVVVECVCIFNLDLLLATFWIYLSWYHHHSHCCWSNRYFLLFVLGPYGTNIDSFHCNLSIQLCLNHHDDGEIHFNQIDNFFTWLKSVDWNSTAIQRYSFGKLFSQKRVELRIDSPYIWSPAARSMFLRLMSRIDFFVEKIV